MACLFGHKWVGCRCEKCGKVRDMDHDFRQAENPCEERCSRCGAVRESHSFVHGCCERCGRAAEKPILPDGLTDEEIRELRPVLISFCQANGYKEGGTRLSLAYVKNGAFERGEASLEQVKDCYSALAALEGRAFTQAEADIILLAARGVSGMLGGMLSRYEGRTPSASPGYKTLTEKEAAPPAASVSAALRESRELYQDGMPIDAYRDCDAIRGTAGLLDSAISRIAEAESAFKAEKEKHA